nr:acyltransferase family protein [Palleniella muris]
MRVRAILIPTLVPVVVYYIVLGLQGYNVLDIFVDSLKRNDHFPLPFCWFLVTLLFLYVLFYAMAIFAMKFFWVKDNFFAVLSVLLFLAIVLCHILHFLPWHYATILAFGVGVGYRNYESGISRNHFLMFMPILLLVIMISCILYLPGTTELLYGLWTIGFFVAYAFVALPEKCPWIVRFFSNISYELYLCQCIGFALIPKTWNPWLIFIGVLCMDILFSVASKRLTKQMFR